MSLPPVEIFAFAGIGFVALFGVWKMGLAPRLQRTRVPA